MSVKIKELPVLEVLDGSEYFPVTDGLDTYKFKLSNINSYVIPEWFGAVGDGITDDTAAIQAALDSDCSVIIIPQGKTFLFTTSGTSPNYVGLNIPEGKTLKGEGGILKLKDDTCTDIDGNYYILYGNAGSVFDNLIIDGNRYNQATFNVADTITARYKNTIIRNCRIYNSVDSGIMFANAENSQCIDNIIDTGRDCGIYISNTDTSGEGINGSIVSGNIISRFGFAGIGIKRATANISVTNNTIEYCGNGITVEDSGGSWYPTYNIISNNILRKIGTLNGITWTPNSSITIGDIRCYQAEVYIKVSEGVYTHSPQWMSYMALNSGTTGETPPMFQGSETHLGTHYTELITELDGDIQWQVNGPRAALCGIVLTKTTRTQVSNNQVFDCEGYGIAGDELTFCNITDNIVNGNINGTYSSVYGHSGLVIAYAGNVQTEHINITNNIVNDFRGYGLRIDNVQKSTISGNTTVISTTLGQGCNIGTDVKECLITNNYFTGYARSYDLIYEPTEYENIIINNFLGNGTTIEKFIRYNTSVASPYGIMIPRFAGERLITTLGGYREWLGTGITNTSWKQLGGASETGITIPTTVPSYIGQTYVDTLNNISYSANGVSSISDWKVNSGTTYYVTPEMYGAKGDGITDDTVALQACFNSGKKSINITNTYKVTSVNIPNGVFRVFGEGKIIDSTGTASTTDKAIITIGGGITGTQQVSGLTLSINLRVNTVGTERAISVGELVNSNIIGCDIQFTTSTQATCDLSGIRIKRPTTMNCSRNLLISGNKILLPSFPTTISAQRAYGITIIGREDVGGSGGYFDNLGEVSQPSDSSERINIVDNIIYDGSHGISINSCYHINIANNVIKNSSHRGIMLEPAVFDSSVSSNTLEGCISSGIILAYGCKRNNIVGNRVHNAVTSGEGGIQAYVGCESNTISNNIIDCRSNYGIYVGCQVSDNIIQNNVISNFRVGGICVENDWRGDGDSIVYAYQKPNSGNPAEGSKWAFTHSQRNIIKNNTIIQPYSDSDTTCAIILGQVVGMDNDSYWLQDTVIDSNTISKPGNFDHVFYAYQATEGRLYNNTLTNLTYGYTYNIDLDSKISFPNGSSVIDYTRYLSGTGTPVSNVTPSYIRQEYLDTAVPKWYKSTGLTSVDWVALN